ncbi:RNA polymerase factor sigma-54 [Porticoccaceae bacterium]|jgi:RNA polymerase sigma-54 factor|nr:RNA polymerase factor sigma-54 [Porticoccaceae bacterium]MDA8598358.1 RNA polymerase factor sigma-54 [Porticoccaceae bacterium]MDB2400386.1 RNA polymerase factor sigma-54 [Porticoccaceae bacterium]
MRPGLQLKFSQQLTMTPQLQQAIKLLQLSTLELSQEITEQLYSNPLLEVDEETGNPGTSKSDVESLDSRDTTPIDLNADDSDIQQAATDATDKPFTEDESDSDWTTEKTTDLPVDASWEESFNTSTPASSGIEEGNWEQVYHVTESLQDHLLWQLNLTPFSQRDQQIAEAYIDAIEPSGMISGNLSDILSYHHAKDTDDPIEDDELLAVLHRLQQFDPPGIFGRDVKETLLIQLNQLSKETPFIEQALRLVSDFLTDIASIDLASLGKKTRYSVEELQGALKLIRSLNPHPGESVSVNDAEYIAPDAYVEKISGRWTVRLNNSNVPRLKINTAYSDLIKRSDNSDQNQYLKDNLAEARWFLRSIESRNDTLMRVAITIVELQQGFLDHGPIAMKPMVLSDIAVKLELHESTISRVTTAKYLATPQGIFELKYFFSSHVGTSAGGEFSSTAVCAILKTLIGAEQPSKPLSDNKLMALLEEQGIQVARRTVAKYRESLGIPSSSQRKRFENAN